MAKLLIIEDDLATLKIYTEAFKKEGYEVIQQATSDIPLHKVVELQPDLIVLDIMLPGKVNGFDLLEAFKSDPRVKEIPVVVLTNLDSEEKVAKQIGADDYLVKANTSMEDVINIVKKHLVWIQQWIFFEVKVRYIYERWKYIIGTQLRSKN